MKDKWYNRLLTEHGSLLVLLLLCIYYSVVTWSEQHPITPRSGRQLARAIATAPGAHVLIAIRPTAQDRLFASALREELVARGARVVEPVMEGAPTDVRATLEELGRAGQRVDAIATHQPISEWGPLQPDSLVALAAQFPSLKDVRVHRPASHHWPNFLTRENLLNVINQNADIAIIAIGMTLVIIAGGIDLSVGSLLALSSVSAAVVIHHWAGGAQASVVGLVGCGLLAILIGAAGGAFSGVMVTRFGVPAFVVTLGVMMVARGGALIVAVQHQRALSGGATEGTPEAVKVAAPAFGALGNGAMLGIPNPVWLMAALYVLAHVVMTRTTLGRRIYAVGGNPEAARLSGVPVRAVLVGVFALCGALAGLAGLVDASRFEGGRPNAGELYELQVIAAVVVGGTSLAGGQGRIFGTLVGALIIAVIQNGLNMAGVKSYEQKVVFGLIILAAVLLDRWKKHRGAGAA